jgi:hypothetical protein
MRTTAHIPLACCLFAIAGAGAPAVAQDFPALFTPKPGAPAPVIDDIMTPRAGVGIDPRVWDRLYPGMRVTILLDDRVKATVSVTEVVHRNARTRVVRGLLDEDPNGTVTLVRHDDATAMRLHAPALGGAFRLHYTGDNSYRVYHINDALAEPCDGGATPPPEEPRVILPDDDDYLPVPLRPDDDQADVGGGCTQSSPVVDMWVLYTPAARDAMGGDSAIRAEAALAVELTNEAYQNSACTQRMRLVRATSITYTESGSLNTDLDRLTGTSDGFMDSIHATRDTINADLVCLYTDTGSGLGWCGSSYTSGFFCAKWSRAAATLTHAHESGHNMGCAHDRPNVDCDPTPNYGYGYTTNGNSGVFSTIMSYGANRVTHYSNPNVNFDGVATGVALASANPCYNAKVINDRDTTVEGFELTRWDIYVEIGANPIVEIGTYTLPYDTLTEGILNIDVPDTGAADVPNLYLRGSTNWLGTITKEMTITPCGGAVTIGN